MWYVSQRIRVIIDDFFEKETMKAFSVSNFGFYFFEVVYSEVNPLKKGFMPPLVHVDLVFVYWLK